MMIGFAPYNSKCTVKLFQKNKPDELMGKSHGRQGDPVGHSVVQFSGKLQGPPMTNAILVTPVHGLLNVTQTRVNDTVFLFIQQHRKIDLIQSSKDCPSLIFFLYQFRKIPATPGFIEVHHVKGNIMPEPFLIESQTFLQVFLTGATDIYDRNLHVIRWEKGFK
jgi:hypothetical protein